MQSLRQNSILMAAVAIGFIAIAIFAWQPANPAPVTRPVIPLFAVSEPLSQGPPASRTLTSASGPNDWVMEGSNPARTRAIANSVLLPLNQQIELRLPGEPDPGSPPVIVRGMLLSESRDHLNAYDIQSGTLRWSFAQTGSYISPAVAGDTVYIRAESNNKGQVVALDIDNGRKIWEFAPREISNSASGYFGGHLTSPVIVDGVVFVGAGHSLYALDARTGKQLWEFNTPDLVTSSATVAGGQVYISDFTTFYAIDRQKGTQLWSYPTLSSMYFSAIASESIVLLTSGDTLVALDPASGMKRWEQAIPGAKLIPAGVQGNIVYTKSTESLFALNAADGKELWRYSELNYVSLPAITRDQVFVVSGMGADAVLAALDPATGRSTWKLPNSKLATTAPVIAGRIIYVATTNGSVIGLWN